MRSQYMRYLLIGLAIIMGAILFELVAAVFMLAAIHLAELLHVQHALGIDTQQSYNYDFSSGSGPMFIAALGFSGLAGGFWHHVNCHQEGCLKIGRFPVAGGQFRTCRKHHPDPKVQAGGITAQHLKIAHENHTQINKGIK